MALRNGKRVALTPAEEDEIAEAVRTKVGTVQEVCEAYGVGATTVYNIVRGIRGHARRQGLTTNEARNEVRDLTRTRSEAVFADPQSRRRYDD